jgi:DNA-binding NarL/FixJ family response regulator
VADRRPDGLVRLLIVDDDDVFRTSLRHLLGEDARIAVTGIAEDLDTAMVAAADGPTPFWLMSCFDAQRASRSSRLSGRAMLSWWC